MSTGPSTGPTSAPGAPDSAPDRAPDPAPDPAPDRDAAGRAVPRGAALVLVVGSLSLLPAVSTDMYLPSLPEVAADLGTSRAGAQFTITGMLVGGAIGQLLVGPFSDRVGRRRPALIGIGLHVVLSLLCAAAADISQLAALRVVQGLVAAGATVVAFAVVRDLFHGAEAARLLSRLMLVIGAAPLLAPSVGGLVATHGGWRGVFVALAALAGVIWLVTLVFLPETLPAARRASRGARSVLRGYGGILRDGHFLALGLLPGLCLAVIMSYVAGSSFVFQVEHGLSKAEFAILFATVGVALVLGSQANAALVRRVGPLRLLRAALPTAVALAVVLVVVAVGRVGGLLGTVGMLWLTLATLGFIQANASALAISRHGERAGTAAAVLGFLQAGVGGALSSAVGPLGGDTAAMTGTILGALALGLVVLAVATPAYRRGGWLAASAPHTDAGPGAQTDGRTLAP